MIIEIPVSSRPGSRFEPIEERLLDPDLIQLAESLPGAKNSLFISREVTGPQGIADLVATVKTGDSLKARRNLQLPPLASLSDAAVVAAFSSRRVFFPESVASRLGMSIEQVKRRASNLATGGYLLKKGHGFCRMEGMTSIGRSYALEAKVNNWKGGLSQALRYGKWCDSASVVLLRPPRNIEEVQQHFKHFQVGLAIRSHWIVRPRLGKPDPGMRLFASELWFDNYLQNPSLSA
ncbi:hypothetical protein CDES_07620 [Corynebacterium deserti GIMN1.010]|uniref:Uncharacterized protein n=1 Tax=Corynebacterium deserti GIMN1.010 TaxID=931089 RepID=A0A0M3Q9N9_9CORY|nr:hypothetical protein [Corynebacterium deserti]ALC05933.1 hypothetical protein CDES_07620 [Corynebacterium deserti GIMN1.010]